MIYREQSDETNTKTWPSTDMSHFDMYSKGSSDATNLIYHDKHITT